MTSNPLVTVLDWSEDIYDLKTRVKVRGPLTTTTLTDTWRELWSTSKIGAPVGIWYDPAEPTIIRVIDRVTKRLYRLQQSDRTILGSSYVGAAIPYPLGLSGDPADGTVYWVLNAPWRTTGVTSGNSIKKVRKSDNVVLASYAIANGRWSALKVSSSYIWLTNLDTDKVHKHSKADGSSIASYTITYASVAQTNPSGIMVDGSTLFYFFSNGGTTARFLKATEASPTVITGVVKTTGTELHGGEMDTTTHTECYGDSDSLSLTAKFTLVQAVDQTTEVYAEVVDTDLEDELGLLASAEPRIHDTHPLDDPHPFLIRRDTLDLSLITSLAQATDTARKRLAQVAQRRKVLDAGIVGNPAIEKTGLVQVIDAKVDLNVAGFVDTYRTEMGETYLGTVALIPGVTVTSPEDVTPPATDDPTPPVEGGGGGGDTGNSYPPDGSLTNDAPNSDTLPASAGQSIIDSTFGTIITKVSDTPGLGDIYAKVLSWTKDGRKLILCTNNGAPYVLLDGVTYAPLATISPPGDRRLSHLDSDLIYGCNGSKFVKYRISTGVTTTIRDFAAQGFSALTIGVYEGNLDDTDTYVILVEGAHPGETNARDKFVIYKLPDDTYTVVDLGQGANSVDNICLSHEGNWYVIVWANDGSGNFQGMQLYDRATQTRQRQLSTLGHRHGDWQWDTDGNEVWLVVSAPHVVMYRADSAVSHQLLPSGCAMEYGHVCGRDIDLPGYAGLSAYGGSPGDYGLGQHGLLKLDPAASVGAAPFKSFGFHHCSGASYWHTPLTTWTRDGTRALFHSDGGNAGGPVYPYVAQAPG